VKHKEVLELKKKLADANMQLKMQSDEGDTSVQLHAQDMKKLQTAHKKSLEMLMACQEENDLLREAFDWAVESRRNAWMAITAAESEADKGVLKVTQDYKARVENELLKLSRDQADYIADNLIENAKEPKSKVNK
jgi:hypothetical protein